MRGKVVLQDDGRTEFPPVSVPRASFHTESEELIEEEDQSQPVPFGQPPHLAFPDHIPGSSAAPLQHANMRAPPSAGHPGATRARSSH
jgi:hypothetical protein